ncbi:MAG: hypothetical protein KDA73_04100 [Rhodobacteraceae bacterium]|nr:hypothetical protein [Paracoccaceae bacterium]
MRRLLIGVLGVAAMSAAASAGGIVELKYKDLRPGNHVLMYWCLAPDEVPEEYKDPRAYTVMPMASSKADAGALMTVYLDSQVYLTTSECLDETLTAFADAGGNPDDLIITEK